MVEDNIPLEQDDQLVEVLSNLIHLDIDAVHAYTSAIDRIDLQEVKNKLIEFRSDHERHVTDLSALVRRMGGEPPEFKPDFKGFLIQGFTALRSMAGNHGAISAMKSNEELTNKTYDEALAQNLPMDVRSAVERNRDDERRHLAYVEQCLADKVWEVDKAA